MRPLARELPWDVLLLVFKEADPSTLAVLGRVSLDFLASTAPILYRDVELSSLESLELLFCEREQEEEKTSSVISRINSHLDLDQIRTLSLNFHKVRVDSKLQISSSRIHRSPILLDNLRVYYGQDEHIGSIRRIYESIFHHLNPLQCACHLTGRPKGRRTIGWVLLGSSFAAEWTRLRDLELSGGITYSLSGRYFHLRGLPAPSLLRRRTIRLHFASLLGHYPPSLKVLLDEIARDFGVYNFGEMQDGSIKLVAQNEEEAREAKEVVRTNEKIARWRNVFAVEVEP